jgi:ADP-dependent NAD(P)H-hydrate dehydratase / NAD(P)H-hydrate epimerase
MLAAYDVAEVRAAEADEFARLARLGLPDNTLMLRAAYGVACAAVSFLGGAYGRRVRLLVGAGNNGGDALYAGAVLARRGARVEAVLLTPERVHHEGLSALLAAGGRVRRTGGRVDPPELVIDGIVGIGATGGVRPEARVALMECGAAPILAVDVPSGVDVDTGEVNGNCVEADLTLALGAHKVAHLVDPAARMCGRVALVDLGLSFTGPSTVALEAADVAGLLPSEQPSGHKYSRGVVGLRTGSKEYPGAAVLSVAGAGCGLAGMVRYDGPAVAGVQAAHPEVVVGPGRVQAWVVGSGGASEAGAALSGCLADNVPTVVDADALEPFAQLRTAEASRDFSHVVLTPHAGELARLLGVDRAEVEARPLHSVREAASRFGTVVVLKGRRTLAAEPGTGRVFVNTTGVPWLATAGSGDVLAGVIGALLAGGLHAAVGAAVGVWLHGSAGAVASKGGPITASEIAAAIPEVVRQLRSVPSA